MALTFTEEEIAPCLLGETILFTLTNSGYALYTLNMLKSLRPYGWDKKVLVVCMDTPASDRFRQKGYHTVNVEEGRLGRFCAWNTKGYDEICYWKLACIHKLLMMNKNVILVDGDIVFRKDPAPHWKEWTDSTHDVWVQNDSQTNGDTTNMCTGYMMIKANPKMCELYDCASEAGKKKYSECIFDNNDQTYFNKFVKPVCSMYPLALEHYPNGKMYMENHKQIDKSCILVHFNWIKGHFKLITMKQYKMWLLTPEEER